MATSQILIQVGTALKWTASGGDYVLTGESITAAAGREGAKGDLTATRAPRYGVRFHVKAGATGPTADTVYSLYWAASPSATAGTSNPGGAVGADQAYAPGSGIATGRKQLILIGVLPMFSTNNGDLNERVFVFSPPMRYGMPVIINDTGQTNASTANATYVEIWPIIPQAQ